MTLLARLPEELLCQIVRYLLPDDVDNFSSSHEEFHAVASRILPRHNELKERYSLISCRYETGTHPIILLRDILQDPEIIWYVKTIDLELSDETTLEMSEEEVNEAQKVAADCESDIFKTVKACPCLDDGEHDWINDILSCYWTPVLILLVCSLTCLENIWIRDSWTNEKLHRLVREFAQTKYLDPASPHAFSKVNHVEEGSTHSEYFTPMESFEPFSRLPTMRRYTGRYLYQQDSWTCPEEKSTITVLELYECIVHIGALRSALRSIANLEEFTYECYVSFVFRLTILLLIMLWGPETFSAF